MSVKFCFEVNTIPQFTGCASGNVAQFTFLKVLQVIREKTQNKSKEEKTLCKIMDSIVTPPTLVKLSARSRKSYITIHENGDIPGGFLVSTFS